MGDGIYCGFVVCSSPVQAGKLREGLVLHSPDSSVVMGIVYYDLWFMFNLVRPCM